jgi:ribosomal protein S18 acetylase RimI-like enzyme
VTRSYLALQQLTELREAKGPRPFRLERAATPCPELGRFLYAGVGARWRWTDRLGWDYARWLQHLDRPELETWVALEGGNPGGFFELERRAGGEVEIAYLGLLPQFIGRGWGAHLLTAAARCGFEGGARRVWLHTCTLDHPNALPNYEARGFRVFRTEQLEEELPEAPPEPWPGAGAVTAEGEKA